MTEKFDVDIDHVNDDGTHERHFEYKGVGYILKTHNPHGLWQVHTSNGSPLPLELRAKKYTTPYLAKQAVEIIMNARSEKSGASKRDKGSE